VDEERSRRSRPECRPAHGRASSSS
jgi:hypothetical protein